MKTVPVVFDEVRPRNGIDDDVVGAVDLRMDIEEVRQRNGQGNGIDKDVVLGFNG